VISDFRREVAENPALMDYYAASIDNFLPKFWDYLSFPSLGFKSQREGLLWILEPRG